MSPWEEALLRERLEKAKRIIGCAPLPVDATGRDNGIIEALMWITLESDEAPRFEAEGK